VSLSTLKVNFSPYILDLVLFKEVDPVKHKATAKDGVLTITLCKKDSGIWGGLEVDGDKDQIKAAKAEATVQQSAVNDALTQQRQERKLAEEKHSLRKQMKLEEMERTRVDNMKQEEKEAAEKEVYEALSQLHVNETAKPAGSKSKPASKHVSFGDTEKAPATNIDALLEADDIDDGYRGPAKSAQSKSAVELEDYEFPEADDHHDQNQNLTISGTSYGTELEPYDEEVRYVPPPRSSGLSTNADQKIGISFTPRVFPTPMRESKAAEEEDWVAKNRRHIKNHGVLGKSKCPFLPERCSATACYFQRTHLRRQHDAL
jgi:dyslexia susceptibility 1 candidate gene 1 protein